MVASSILFAIFLTAGMEIVDWVKGSEFQFLGWGIAGMLIGFFTSFLTGLMMAQAIKVAVSDTKTSFYSS